MPDGGTKVALLATPGSLASGVTRRLEQDGHDVQSPLLPKGALRAAPSGGNGNAARIRQALRGARVLLHISSAGIVNRFAADASSQALAPLAWALAEASSPAADIQRLVVVSPAVLYGEGSYYCPVNGPVTRQWRRSGDLRAGQWEHRCPVCSEQLVPAPTSETHPAAPLSVSGLLVYTQERLAMEWALERRIPVVALRYFEMYGGEPSGSVGELVTRALDGLPLELKEDGGQTRDYVHQEDVVRSISWALSVPCDDLLMLNVGTGSSTSAASLAVSLQEALGQRLRVRCSQSFDLTEPRHLFSATAQTERLGYRAMIPLAEGLERYLRALRNGKEKAKRVSKR